MRLALALSLLMCCVPALAGNIKPYSGSLDCDDTAVVFDFSSPQAVADSIIDGAAYRRASRTAYVDGFLGAGLASKLFAPSGVGSILCTIMPAHWCDGPQCYVAPWALELVDMSPGLPMPLSNGRIYAYVEWLGLGGEARLSTLSSVYRGMTLASGDGACVHRGKGQKQIGDAQVRIYFALELQATDDFAGPYGGTVFPAYRLTHEADPLNLVSIPCAD